MLIRYSLFLRPGKVGSQSRSDEKNLYDKSVTCHPNFDNPQDISIKVDASKTNRWKHKTENIYARCNCDQGGNRPLKSCGDIIFSTSNLIRLQVKHRSSTYQFSFVHISNANRPQIKCQSTIHEMSFVKMSNSIRQ